MTPLYCIIGPSGTGKSTLEENIKSEFNWLRSADSYTTRPPRYAGEHSHKFVSKEQFDKLKLLAYTRYNGYEYGVTKEILDNTDLYVVDLDGLLYLKEHYTNRPIITIGLEAEPSVRYDRMIARGDSIEKANNRIEHDGRSFINYLDYCDVVLDANGDENSVLAQFVDKVIEFETSL